MIYALVLNDMRSPNVENVTVVRLDNDRDALARWYAAQLAPEPWKDGHWNKAFRQGSELEWFNPVARLDIDNDYWGGIWEVADGGIGASLVKSR